MANLLSSGILACSRIPEKYVVPPVKRPALTEKVNIPVIDLLDGMNSINKNMKAIQDFGLFQVINHGILNDLSNDAMQVCQEVLNLPPEEISKIVSEDDVKQICRIYSGSLNYDKEEFHFWRDILRLECTPLEECIKFWPQKPEQYREIVGDYVKALKGMGSNILELISQVLSLDKGYLSRSELSEDNVLTINHYPPCPDPSITIGLPKHKDPSLLSIVHATPVDIPGLQLFKDGQWFDVQAAPNAYFVFVGSQLEVVSNGKLKAGVHRVVTNAKARTSAVFFISPTMECIVEPAKELVETENGCPLYRSFKYKEYFEIHTGHDGDRDAMLEDYNFKIK